MRTRDLQQCRVILFDFGGTLDSDGEHWLDRFYELYEKFGVAVPKQEVKRVFYLADAFCCEDPHVNRMGLRDLMEHHVRFQFRTLQLNNPQIERMFIDDFCTKTERILERNAKILEKLAKRFRLGVVSNFYGNVPVICQEAGLAQFLTLIADSTRLGMGKPGLEIFQYACRELQAQPAECAFVGDSYERDMLPARRLGMTTVWLKGSNPWVPDDAEPVDYCVARLTELERLVS